MTRPISIRDRDRAIVRAILDAHLPRDATVRVFGSRARGAARRASDLDLAIDAHRPMTPRERHALADAFEESDLPYGVDLVDVRAASPKFLAIIAREWTPFEG